MLFFWGNGKGLMHQIKLNRLWMTKSGFSLIELLVVIAIIGILASVGTIGYQNYMDGVKYKTTTVNREMVAKKINNDQMGQEANMRDSKTCYDYIVEDIIGGEDDIHDNAYNSSDNQSWVNGHQTTEFDQGQHLIYCARPAETFDPINSAIMICSCAIEEGCVAGGSVCPNPVSFP